MRTKSRVLRWRDPTVWWLFLAGSLYACFFSLGLPLWDDDFTSYLRPLASKSILEILWNWISPLSTQPQYWGFNERPAEWLFYKALFQTSGYVAWPYFLLKSPFYGGLWSMVYLWVHKITNRKDVGVAAALLFGVAPGPILSQFMLQDFAPVAEFFLALLGFWMWSAVESTPVTWTGWPDLRNKKHIDWLKRWIGISVSVYLAIKIKGDVRILILILMGYVMLVRPAQWRFFLIPVCVMGILSVPWGPSILSKLPPWFPGSSGSEIAWMYQPASPARIWDFVGSTHDFTLKQMLFTAPLSLFLLLFPFFVLPVLAMVLVTKPDTIFSKKSAVNRAALWVGLWLSGAFLVVMALPELKLIFRVRYGILTWLPACILFGIYAGSFLKTRTKHKTLWLQVGVALWIAQLGLNFYRSVELRDHLGQVIILIDRVYAKVTEIKPQPRLVMLPGFLLYDYRPGVSAAIEHRESKTLDDLVSQNYPPNETYVVSWNAPLDIRVEMVEMFKGGDSESVFDWVFSCGSDFSVKLMKYVGVQPSLLQARTLKEKGRTQEALAIIEPYLSKFPLNLGAQFEAQQLYLYTSQWWKAHASSLVLENYTDRHPSVLYNHSIALHALGFYDEAISRLQTALEVNPKKYGVLYYLFESAKKKGDQELAFQTIKQMRELFPEDESVMKMARDFGLELP